MYCISQKIADTFYSGSRNDWKNVFSWIICFLIIINTFQKSWEVFMHLVCPSVRSSVRALTFVSILQTSWNLYILFKSDIEWTVEKIVCMELRVRLQRHTNFSDTLRLAGRKILKLVSTYCTKYNEINIRHLCIQKHVSYKK